MERLCNLLFEVSNHDRLRILIQLDQEAMTITRLSKKLEMTTQESSRHLSRLAKVRVTQKDVDGRQHLTPYGKLVLQLLPALEVLSKHQAYFTSHSLTHLPSEFVSRISELSDSTYTEDVMVFFHNVETGIQEAEECIWVMVDQFLMSHIPSVQEALKRGVKMQTIEPEVWVAPSDFYRIREEAERSWAAQARAHGLLEHRMLEKIDVYIHMSEKRVALAFPTFNGTYDHLGFTATDERALKWCKDLFEYYWERAGPLTNPLREYS